MISLGGGISPTITNMHNQGSLLFNGTDEYVNIDNVASTLTYETLSVSLWVQIATVSSSGNIFKVMVGTDTDNQIIILYHASANELRATTKLGGVADVLNQGSNSIENDGLWHHVVLLISKTSGNWTKLYVDNSEKESITGVGTLSGTLSKASIANNTADGGYFKGSIDEVAIWNRVITTDEIAAIYNAGSSAGGGEGIDIVGQMGTDLKAYYRFEEKSGTVALNSCHPDLRLGNGTLINTPTYQSIHP